MNITDEMVKFLMKVFLEKHADQVHYLINYINSIYFNYYIILYNSKKTIIITVLDVRIF